MLLSGTSHPILAKEIASLLNIPLVDCEIQCFPDEEIYVEIKENVQSRQIYVIQSLGHNPNYHLMELFIILDALKRAAASSVTVIIPYFAYARQDRLNKSGEPITAKLLADLLTASGIHAIITMDLHSEQIEGFFDVPVIHLLSRKILIPFFKNLKVEDWIIAAPDKGAIKIASAFSNELEAPLALIDKERQDSFHVNMRLFLGDVTGKTVLLVDDMCSTGGTLVNAAQVCMDNGAKKVVAAVGHGLFSAHAIEIIEKSPIQMIIATNSIPQDHLNFSKLKTLSIAQLIADAIQQGHAWDLP